MPSIITALPVAPREETAAPVQGIAAPVSRWESLKRSAAAGFLVQRAGAREEEARAQMWRRHLAAEKATGTTIPRGRFMTDAYTTWNPVLGEWVDTSDMQGDRAWAEAEQLSVGDVGAGLDDDAYEAQLDKLRATHPQAMAGIATRKQLDDQRAARFNRIAGEAAEAAQQHPVAAFAGGAAGTMADPINLLATAYTGGLGASRGLAMRMLAQGGANAGVEALQQPLKAVDAARFGGPKWTPGQAVSDVAMAGAGGAAFEVGGAVLGGALRRFLPAPEAAAARAVQVIEDADRLDAALAGLDGEADSAARAAIERVQIPALEPSRGLDDLFPDDLGGGPSGGPRRVDYRGRTVWADSFDPAALEVAPELFQYKADGDAQGVTARLKGVEAWDPTSSGKVIVWERADGTQVVADGHQRRALAQRMESAGWDARLDGYLMREADGWTAPQVRVVAALKNIREGSGTILDAAKVFRTAPDAIKDGSLPVTGDFIGQARGLAQLSPEAFGAVVNKVIPERYGSDIGLMAGNRPELHRDMVALLHKGEPANVDEARAMIAEALQDDWIKTQGDTIDLFGHDPSVSGMIARAKVAASVKRSLGRDAALYGQLVKHADAIEAGGNALARDANEAQLALDRAALEVTSRLAMRSGPIGEAMAEAAAKVTAGESPATAAKGVLARVRAALKAGEALDEARGAVIDPPATPEAARAGAEPFGDPYGPAAEAQARAKPEQAELEADAAQGGMFDDLPQMDPYERAHKALTPCAPA